MRSLAASLLVLAGMTGCQPDTEPDPQSVQQPSKQPEKQPVKQPEPPPKKQVFPDLDTWSQFAPGSFVEVRVDMRGRGGIERTELLRREAGVSVTHGSMRLDDAPARDRGESARTSVKAIETIGWSRDAPRQEVLQIGEQAIPCEVTTWRDPQSDKTATFWNAKRALVPVREMVLPGPDLLLSRHVLKFEHVHTSRTRKITTTAIISSLAETRRIGDREVTCAVEDTKMTTRGRGTQTNRVRSWLSSEVPGQIVRKEFDGPGRRGSGEVVAYRAIPRTK